MRIRTLLAVAMVMAACGGGAPSDTTTGATPAADAPAGPARAVPNPDAPVDALADGFNRAGFELMLAQPAESDFVFSPASIGHALLMVRAAADQPTGAAIDAAFALPEAAHQAWNSVDQAMASAADSEDELVVAIADRVWPRLDLDPDPEWLDLLAAEHGATVQPLDFTGDPGGSRDTINRWIEDRTEGLIPELLPEGFIEPATTVLVLTDALYFEARWQIPFGKYGPVSGTFTRLDGSEVPVEFMHELELSDLRGAGDGFAGAEIPYVGGDFSMLVIVPDGGRFEEVRGRLGTDLLAEVDEVFETGPYELLLPKWEDDVQLDLIGRLTEIGAAPGAYPAIGPDVFLAEAVHGADIAVDEWGTVAAAATALGFEESGPPEPELAVAADKPFLYLIRHRPSGLVLFAGQVTDPTG